MEEALSWEELGKRGLHSALNAYYEMSSSHQGGASWSARASRSAKRSWRGRPTAPASSPPSTPPAPTAPSSAPPPVAPFVLFNDPPLPAASLAPARAPPLAPASAGVAAPPARVSGSAAARQTGPRARGASSKSAGSLLARLPSLSISAHSELWNVLASGPLRPLPPIPESAWLPAARALSGSAAYGVPVALVLALGPPARGHRTLALLLLLGFLALLVAADRTAKAQAGGPGGDAGEGDAGEGGLGASRGLDALEVSYGLVHADDETAGRGGAALVLRPEHERAQERTRRREEQERKKREKRGREARRDETGAGAAGRGVSRALSGNGDGAVEGGAGAGVAPSSASAAVGVPSSSSSSSSPAAAAATVPSSSSTAPSPAPAPAAAAAAAVAAPSPPSASLAPPALAPPSPSPAAAPSASPSPSPLGASAPSFDAQAVSRDGLAFGGPGFRGVGFRRVSGQASAAKFAALKMETELLHREVFGEDRSELRDRAGIARTLARLADEVGVPAPSEGAGYDDLSETAKEIRQAVGV